MLPNALDCPHCGESRRLKVVQKPGRNPVGFACAHCSSVFDLEIVYDEGAETLTYFGNRRNPEYQLTSDDWAKNLLKAIELDKKGTPLHLEKYVIYIEDAR